MRGLYVVSNLNPSSHHAKIPGFLSEVNLRSDIELAVFDEISVKSFIKLFKLRPYYNYVFIRTSQRVFLLVYMIRFFSRANFDIFYWHCGTGDETLYQGLKHLFWRKLPFLFALKYSDLFFTGSSSMLSYYLQHYPSFITRGKSRILKNDIPTYEGINLELEPITIVSLMNWSKVRANGDLYIGIIENILRLNKKVNFRLIGDGEVLNRIKQKISDDNVTFVGRVLNVEVQNVMRGTLFMHITQQEGMPRTVLEAMSCGLPLLVSDIPSLSELCENTAVLTDNTIENICSEILRLIDDKEKLIEMSTKSKSESLKYNTSNVAENFIEIVKLYGGRRYI